MSKLLTREELCLRLGVSDLSHLSKDKIISFVELIPQMDRNLSLKIIKGLENKSEIALDVIKRLNILCEEAISNSYDIEQIRGYQKTLDSLDYMIRDKGASFEDNEYCLNEMHKASSKLNINDEDFINGLVSECGAPIGLVLIIGAAICGSYKR